jgi:hypothetical protein
MSRVFLCRLAGGGHPSGAIKLQGFIAWLLAGILLGPLLGFTVWAIVRVFQGQAAAAATAPFARRFAVIVAVVAPATFYLMTLLLVVMFGWQR